MSRSIRHVARCTDGLRRAGTPLSRHEKSSSQHITTHFIRISTFIFSNLIPPATRYPHVHLGPFSRSSAVSSAVAGAASSPMRGRARAAPCRDICSRIGSGGTTHRIRSRTRGRRHDTNPDVTGHLCIHLSMFIHIMLIAYGLSYSSSDVFSMLYTLPCILLASPDMRTADIDMSTSSLPRIP